jgi:hypothetical protein
MHGAAPPGQYAGELFSEMVYCLTHNHETERSSCVAIGAEPRNMPWKLLDMMIVSNRSHSDPSVWLPLSLYLRPESPHTYWRC